MVQKAYTNEAAVGLVGQISAVGGEQRIVSYICSTDIEPGTALSFTADGRVTNVGSGTLAYAGIALNTLIGSSAGGDTYQAGDLVPVADKVSVYCELTAGTAAIGAPVYRVTTTGAITAQDNATSTLIPNARFESAAVGSSTNAPLVDVRLG
ncbi:MAG: hypothetical protein K0U41_09910 [Gammaproteobacteria bacterium]|nr:hypothetical protein [Gammaproteobacteria bacterium]